jgi:multimeric flavodoxin WrbA
VFGKNRDNPIIEQICNGGMVMSAVILDAFENENDIGVILKKQLGERGQKFSYFKLKDMNIKRCIVCGSCADRTPGRCVIKDDMELIFRAIAKEEWLFMLTPLRFGGHSSRLKLAIDRFMVLGLPLYYVKDGTLFHRTRYDHKKLIAIAVSEKNIEGQEENFSRIVAQNAANLSYSGKALVVKADDGLSKVKSEIAKLFDI